MDKHREPTDLALRLALLEGEEPQAPDEGGDEEPEARLAAWARDACLPGDLREELRWSWKMENWIDDCPVRDLSGIDLYSELQLLDLRESSVTDLSPLSNLAKLRVLHVGVTSGTDLAPLLRCPGLRRVRLHGFDEKAHGECRDQLSERGVHVDPCRPSNITSPFRDANLQLAVLDTLWCAGKLELPELFVIDEFEFDQENYNRLLRVELRAEHLASVTKLFWAGGGMKIQHLIWPQWSGEPQHSDEEPPYDIRSLRGIEMLPNLQELKLAHCTAPSTLETDLLDALRLRGVQVKIE